jgi:flavin-binding protein dodecin
MTSKTSERSAIEKAIKRATDRNESISSVQLVSETGLSQAEVKKHIANLTAEGKVDNVGGKGPGQARYTWARGPVLVTPDNGPGYTPTTNQRKFASGIPVIDMPTTTGGPPSDPMRRGDYDGKELQPNPGITPDRFAAYLLPSLVNGVRVAPKRITAMCVGKAPEVFAPGRLQQ